MNAGAACSPAAKTGYVYRVWLQQRSGDGWVNMGQVGKVSIPPGGSGTATATYTCGTTIADFAWRTNGHWYRNGVQVGLNVPSSSEQLNCS